MSEIAALSLAVLAGTLRISVALLWVAVGDCLTQRVGHFNLGLEGIVALSAMAAVAAAGAAGGPWAGVLAGAAVGGLFALAFILCAMVPRVSELGVGIALLVAGVSLARFAGSDLVSVPAQLLPALSFAGGALEISVMLPLALAAALGLSWLFSATRAGLLLRAAGESGADGAMRPLGIRTAVVRAAAVVAGGSMGGLGGACLGLFYPGGWSDELTAGVGIIGLTLAFLARHHPLRAAAAAIIFAAVAALGPAFQVAYGTASYHLLNALPYAIAIAMLIAVSRPRMAG